MSAKYRNLECWECGRRDCRVGRRQPGRRMLFFFRFSLFRVRFEGARQHARRVPQWRMAENVGRVAAPDLFDLERAAIVLS